MKRACWNILCGVSLLLMAACLCLWEDSFVHHRRVTYEVASNDVVVYSLRGEMVLMIKQTTETSPYIYDTVPSARMLINPAGRADDFDVYFLGFGVSWNRPHWSRSMINVTRFSLPAWFLALIFGAAPLIWIIHWQRSRTIPPHLCQSCGYDLTGNQSGNCPECGVDLEAEASVEPTDAPAIAGSDA